MPSPKNVRHAVTRAIEELVRDHEVQRLVLFLQRANRAKRENSLHSQLFHAVDVGAKIQLGRQIR